VGALQLDRCFAILDTADGLSYPSSITPNTHFEEKRGHMKDKEMSNEQFNAEGSEDGEEVIVEAVPKFMSPLADPVVGAIFNSVEHAGLAAKSLVGSILSEDGYTIGKVTSVIPQMYYKEYPNYRGCRIDIHMDTSSGESIIVEIQLWEEPIMARNLFESTQLIATHMKPGTATKDLDVLMPHIIVINILNFVLRKDHDDFIQPVGILYTKAPNIIAEEHLRIYNVQLPLFRKREHDLTKPLDAWLYILDTANRKELTVEEVIEMEPLLKDTIDLDEGLRQFTERYKKISGDLKIQQEYNAFYSEYMRQVGMRYCAIKEGRAEGKAEGKAEAKEEYAIKMLKKGMDLELIQEITEIPLDKLQQMQKEITS
jgi:predicted transposase/invertase (TIGR01784 family)